MTNPTIITRITEIREEVSQWAEGTPHDAVAAYLWIATTDLAVAMRRLREATALETALSQRPSPAS